MALVNGDGANRGAGVNRFGSSHVTKCPQSNNPYGHNPECECGWAKGRASQSVPYEDDAPVFEKSPHGKWWTIPVGDA